MLNIIEITFTSTYPLKSDVIVEYSARGSYVCQDPPYHGGQAERPDEGEFDTELEKGDTESVLKKGETQWIFQLSADCPGSTDVAYMTGSVGWIVPNQYDDTYEYLKGGGDNTF